LIHNTSKATQSRYGSLKSENMLKNLILKNRSYRRFYQDVRIPTEVLRSLVDLARLSPSGGNLQPLKYILSNNQKTNELIFPCLNWAGTLKDWPGPEVGERPSAYIIILGDSSIKTSVKNDQAIAAQSIMLGAVEKGFGGCIIGSVKREQLRQALKINIQYEIFLVLALGKPKEKVIIENLNDAGDIKYWRDENQVHHVPKRKLDDLILG